MPCRFLAIVSCLFILAGSPASFASPPVEGNVVGVHDGDSITVLTADKVQVKVRLEGIDAPELKQAFGNTAKAALSGLVFEKPVVVNVTGKDRYKRTLGVVMVGGVNANLELVRLGMAWRYDKYSKDAALLAAQNEAKAAKRGLWADSDPVPPWAWRKK